MKLIRISHLLALLASHVVAIQDLVSGGEQLGNVFAGDQDRTNLVAVVVVGGLLDDVLAVGVVAVGGDPYSGPWD